MWSNAWVSRTTQPGCTKPGLKYYLMPGWVEPTNLVVEIWCLYIMPNILFVNLPICTWYKSIWYPFHVPICAHLSQIDITCYPLIPLFTSIIGPSDVSKVIKMILFTNYRLRIRQARVWSTRYESKSESNHPDEQDLVVRNAIINLTEEDRQLPQITNLLPFLRRGIGIHRGSLLLILKEAIEILFQEGLIRDRNVWTCQQKPLYCREEVWRKGVSLPALGEYLGVWMCSSTWPGRLGSCDCDSGRKLEPVAAKTTVKDEADRLDWAIQHDPEFDESRRHQPRTCDWKVLFPAP